MNRGEKSAFLSFYVHGTTTVGVLPFRSFLQLSLVRKLLPQVRATSPSRGLQPREATHWAAGGCVVAGGDWPHVSPGTVEVAGVGGPGGGPGGVAPLVGGDWRVNPPREGQLNVRRPLPVPPLRTAVLAAAVHKAEPVVPLLPHGGVVARGGGGDHLLACDRSWCP